MTKLVLHRDSHEVKNKHQLELQSSEGSIGTKGSASELGCWQEALLLHHVGFSTDLFMIWQLAFSRMREQLDRSCNILYSLISKQHTITSAVFYYSCKLTLVH